MVTRLPGVYPKIIIEPQLLAVPGSLRKAVLIGTGSDTYNTLEEVTRGGGDSDILQHAIFQVNKVYNFTQIFVRDVDYRYDSGGNQIIWQWDGKPQNGTAPASSTKYFVDYTFPKSPTDYVPKAFTSLKDVVDEYGYPSSSDEIERYMISVAAQILFENAVSSVLCYQPVANLANISNAEYLTAFNNALEVLKDYDVNIIIPLYTRTNYSDFLPSLKTHVEQMSSTEFRKYRIGLYGLSLAEGITINSVKQLAQAISSTRIGLGLFKGISKIFEFGEVPLVGTLGVFGVVPLAGISTSALYDSAEPWTNKNVIGIKGTAFFNRAEMIELLDAGVITYRTYTGFDTVVLEGTSTDRSTFIGQEMSIITSLDEVVQSLQTQLEKAFIGRKFSRTLLIELIASGNAILAAKKEAGIIFDARIIDAREDPTNPFVAILTIRLRNIYSLKEIDLNVIVTTKI
jgi:hypothetical protein